MGVRKNKIFYEAWCIWGKEQEEPGETRVSLIHVPQAPPFREPSSLPAASICIPLCKGFLQGPSGLLCPPLLQATCKCKPPWRQPSIDDWINTPDLMLLWWENSDVCPTLVTRVPYWGEAPVSHCGSCPNNPPFLAALLLCLTAPLPCWCSLHLPNSPFALESLSSSGKAQIKINSIFFYNLF